MSKIPRITPPYLVIMGLSILILSVYWQVGDYSFIGLDDDFYVFKNPYVQRGLVKEGVAWAFTTFYSGIWHPLTWLSHMSDVQLFGLDAGWHHRMNVLYHLFNTGLLFIVLWQMTGGLWRSAFVAALFGVHPLHVESVAWVAERKDVLSTLFWILTMGAYLRYTRRPCVKRYLSVLVFFAIGLMCKPMLITLPFVLLLLDWWPLRRLGQGTLSVREVSRAVWEKIPLLSLSAAASLIAFLAQAHASAVIPLEHSSIGLRISNAFVSYVAYLWKMVWPSSLVVFYPHPASIQGSIPMWKMTGAILLLGGFFLIVLWQRYRRPYLAVGWLWYLGTLVPVIGLVQIGAQAMADRYTYVPLLGIFIAVAWAIPAVVSGRFRWFVLGVWGGLIVALSVAAWNQAGYWRNSVTLFSRAVAVTSHNWFAWNNLGMAHTELGQTEQAIASFQEALRIRPAPEIWFNLGVSYDKLGQTQQAIIYYREALRIGPDYVDAWNNLAVVHYNLGQFQMAIIYYREALRIRPDFAEAWNNLGLTYAKLALYQKAIDCYREALRIRPDFAEAWNNLKVIYNKTRPESVSPLQ